MGKSPFAIDSFTWVARGKHVEIATVNDVTKNEISGDNSDVAQNIGSNNDDIVGKNGLAVHGSIDATIANGAGMS